VDVELSQRDGRTLIRGRFFRIVPRQRAGLAIHGSRPDAAGRFHAPGQPALYMSPTAEWAAIGLSTHAMRDGDSRVVVPLDVTWAEVIDLRNGADCRAAGVSPKDADAPWRDRGLEGEKPKPWTLADRVRFIGCDGLIDPSKLKKGAWHLVLFEWNQPNRPEVRPAGVAVPLSAE